MTNLLPINDAALRFRVETACDGYSALWESDVPDGVVSPEDYLRGAHDAAEAIRSCASPPGPCPDTGVPVESCLCMTHDPDGAHFRATRVLDNLPAPLFPPLEPLEVVAEVEDQTGDVTTVLIDDGALRNGPNDEPYLHLTVQDQTLLFDLDEDAAGGYSDTARGVYTLPQALELQDAINQAIERMKALAR